MSKWGNGISAGHRFSLGERFYLGSALIGLGRQCQVRAPISNYRRIKVVTCSLIRYSLAHATRIFAFRTFPNSEATDENPK